MKVYTVERMDKCDYVFSVQIRKGGCYSDKKKALERAKKMYKRMCREYEDEILRYFDNLKGTLEVDEDHENGYYRISFGFEEDYEVHSVAVEEWEMEE